MKQINQTGEKMKNNKKYPKYYKESVVVDKFQIKRINSYVELLDITYGLGKCPTMDRLKNILKEIEL